MLERIISLSIRHRWVVLALVLVSAVIGVWSFQKLPIDATPALYRHGPTGCLVVADARLQGRVALARSLGIDLTPEVTDAAEKYSTARKSLVQANYDLQVASAALAKALGRPVGIPKEETKR